MATTSPSYIYEECTKWSHYINVYYAIVYSKNICILQRKWLVRKSNRKFLWGNVMRRMEEIILYVSAWVNPKAEPSFEKRNHPYQIRVRLTILIVSVNSKNRQKNTSFECYDMKHVKLWRILYIIARHTHCTNAMNISNWNEPYLTIESTNKTEIAEYDTAHRHKRGGAKHRIKQKHAECVYVCGVLCERYMSAYSVDYTCGVCHDNTAAAQERTRVCMAVVIVCACGLTRSVYCTHKNEHNTKEVTRKKRKTDASHASIWNQCSHCKCSCNSHKHVFCG